DRELFLGGIEPHALRHGEARERTRGLDAQIVMTPRRVVEVHDERALPRLPDRRLVLLTRRLVRRAGVPLLTILAELVVGHDCTRAQVTVEIFDNCEFRSIPFAPWQLAQLAPARFPSVSCRSPSSFSLRLRRRT